jgi:hypothetical protein
VTWLDNGLELGLTPYWINITQPNNAVVDILDWNDTFGTSLAVKTASVHTIQLLVAGNATHVGNASYWHYDQATRILTANVTGGQTLNVNWQTGATVRLLDPFFDNGGCMIGKQHTFQVIIYAENGTLDIKCVHLELATGTDHATILKYNRTDGTFTKESDPKNCYQLNSTACSSTIEDNNTYLNLNFTGTFSFSNYTTLNHYEDTNVTLQSTLYGNLSNLQAGTYYALNWTLCAEKTMKDGCFYVPSRSFVNVTVLRVELLFNDSHLVGDQNGGASPYPTITHYPDGKIDGKDIAFVAWLFGESEGATSPHPWDYMADVNGDHKVDGADIAIVAKNFDPSGNYSGVGASISVTFDTGEVESPDANGFAAIPPSATRFNVTLNGTQIGAMIIFCGP